MDRKIANKIKDMVFAGFCILALWSGMILLQKEGFRRGKRRVSMLSIQTSATPTGDIHASGGGGTVRNFPLGETKTSDRRHSAARRRRG
jgi:hypothetical protein